MLCHFRHTHSHTLKRSKQRLQTHIIRKRTPIIKFGFIYIYPLLTIVGLKCGVYERQ